MRNLLRGLTVAIATVVALCAVTEAAAGTPVRQVSVRYAGGQDSVYRATSVWTLGRDTASVCAVSPGLACIRVNPHERRISFNVRDVSLRKVSGLVQFMRYRLSSGPSVEFCQRGSFAIPPGTTRIEIHLDATTLRCGLTGSGVATAGRVTARLS